MELRNSLTRRYLLAFQTEAGLLPTGLQLLLLAVKTKL